MNQKYWVALVTSILGIGIIYYFMAVVYKDDQWKEIGGAVVLAVELVILLAVGLPLAWNQKTKPIGKGILLGAGITLLVGFGICSSV